MADPADAAIGAARVRALLAGALIVGLAVAALELYSEHRGTAVVRAVFAAAVGWSFIGTGLYAWLHRPESRIGALMVLLGFAWFLFTLDASDSSLVFTISQVTGALWGGVFLHLGLSFPSGRLTEPADRALAIAGYLIFPLAFVPSMLFTAHEAPENLLLVDDDETLSAVATAFGALLYVGLFVLVCRRAAGRWTSASPSERYQLTPVYVCALLTFALVTVARAGVGDVAWWLAFISTGLMPFAFLGGLLRSHVSHLDAELDARMEELRASRARLVEAGDAARRQLERDLHDGAQARLVALALLLRTAKLRARDDPGLVELLDRASDELQTGLSELRELARGIHPAVLTERGLEPALRTLVSRAPVPVTVDAADGRLPGPVESAAYFVVSEALQNVAKYANATQASVTVQRTNGHVTVDVTDDGVGGANTANGSGLRGLADRVAALDGTLSLESPPGRGTRLRAKIPV